MLFNPGENHGVRFLRRLPEEAVGLPLENFKLRAGDPFGQDLRLRQMVAAAGVPVADNHQSRDSDIAQAVRSLPIVARDDVRK